MQLRAHGELVLGGGVGTLRLAHLAVDPQQVLHMTTDFMGQDVGLGKIAVGAEAVFELIVKSQIDVIR